MPERVTSEERLISLAIEKAREVKELMSDPNGLDFTEDEKLEMEKVKRPKAEKVTTKIPNQEKEGYGLAGQEIKKSYLRPSPQGGNRIYIQMNTKRDYPRDEVMGAISSLGITEERAKMNSQSAEHLEYLLNIDNPNYPIPRDRMVRILNKKYNLNLRQDGPSMYDRQVSRNQYYPQR